MATKMIGGDRPVRRCGGLGVGCGQSDDHPRHVVEVPGSDDVAYHLDCHAAAGCASCQAQVSGADGATGAQMLDHILANAPAPQES